MLQRLISSKSDDPRFMVRVGAAPDSNFPAIYIWGTVNNISGIFRSVDGGASWVRINDSAHQFGGGSTAAYLLMLLFSLVLSRWGYLVKVN